MQEKHITVQKILVFIFGLPILLVVLFIGYEIVGMAVNHAAGDKQTKKLTAYAEEQGFEIVATDTFVGNSGNGNHVDLISKIYVKSESSSEELSSRLGSYDGGDIRVCEPNEDELTKAGITAQEDGIYMLRLFNSAPFVDNIEGH